eukprot:942458-Amphidinium_carterae.1
MASQCRLHLFGIQAFVARTELQSARAGGLMPRLPYPYPGSARSLRPLTCAHVATWGYRLPTKTVRSYLHLSAGTQ